MQEELLSRLEERPEYVEYKKKRKIRSIALGFILIVFWIILLDTTDIHNIDATSLLYAGILRALGRISCQQLKNVAKSE